MIDIEKFICDVYKLASVRANHELCHVLDYAFRKQGLEYKDGKIANVEPNKEPKFKKGDWVVVNDGRIGRIVECTKYFADVDLEFSRLSTRVNNIRSWTIQDAKAGDVLSFNDGHGNDCIELIKSITDKKIEFWFCLTNGNRYEVFDGIIPYTNLVSREDATPATKEQRDFLFQKMKEAGYEWDAEHKQLKMIEPREEPTKFERGYRKAVEDAWEIFGKGFPNDCRDVVKQYFDKGMEQKLKELSQG